MTLPDGLLAAARNYLDITWPDPDGDEKLSGILKRGIQYLNGVAGTALDFAIEDTPRALLLDYARYVRAEALDEFQSNYLHELLNLQIREEAARVETERQQAADV